MRSLIAVLLVAACADASTSALETDEVVVDAETTVETAELRVRASDTTVWVDRAIVRRGDTFVMEGRASRNVNDGNAFVFDDPYGQFAKKSARVFTVSWELSELRTLSDGVDQFVSLSFAHSNGRPDAMTARVVARPRLTEFSGSSKIYIVAALAPVIVAGETVYRITGRTTEASYDVTAQLGDVRLTVQRLDAKTFAIDLTPDQAHAAFGKTGLVVRANLPGGGGEKTAKLGLSIDKLGLTALDAYDVWPRPTCTPTVRSCLAALPDGALDLASCGEAFVVRQCQGQIGVVFDDVAFGQALDDLGAQLATPAARADAQALAGSDRVDQFLEGANATVEYRFERLFGRWYLSTTARDRVVAQTREAGLDYAYAYPLELIEPHAAQPGNAAAMRQFAADQVLAELAAMNFVGSEFQRPLVEIVHEFRARHVASIRAFRETIAPEPYPGTPAWDAYLGDWLGLYTEVVIERATGTVVQRLVEID